MAPESNAGLILADNQLLREIREQGWESWFFEEWRWFGLAAWRAATQKDA